MGKGIKQQIEVASTKEFELGNLSVQMLEDFIKEFKENAKKNPNLNFEHQIFPMAEKDEVYTWKDKIKEGYLYQMGTSPYIMTTGQGVAIMYGENLEKLGFSNDQIEEDICITETEGIQTDTVFYPIKYITWHRNEK